LRQSHLAFPLSTEVDTFASQAPDVTQTRKDHLTSDTRIDATLDQLARAHLDMEGDLVIHFLGDVDMP
jgi:hypothetical protein